MSNAQLSKSKGDLKTLLSSDAMREQFAAALPTHLPVERFCRVAITSLSRIPKLRDCTPESFFKCLLDLSAMGLEPDGRRAHLIPYGKECTLILDYKGLVELARRSGDVAKIHADVVCENDNFNHSMGEVTAHDYALDKPRGKVIGAYAQVTLKDGSVQAAILSKDEVDGIRKRSRAGSSGPWVTDYNEMAKKTAFRRLTKWLTLSPEAHQAITAAEESEFKGMRNVTPQRAIPQHNPFRSAPLDGVQGEPGTAEVPAAEERQEEGGGGSDGSPSPVHETEAVPADTANEEGFVCYVENIKVNVSKPDAQNQWTMHVLEYSAEGTIGEASTFSSSIGEQLAELREGDKIRLCTKQGKKGALIESVQLISAGGGN